MAQLRFASRIIDLGVIDTVSACHTAAPHTATMHTATHCGLARSMGLISLQTSLQSTIFCTFMTGLRATLASAARRAPRCNMAMIFLWVVSVVEVVWTSCVAVFIAAVHGARRWVSMATRVSTTLDSKLQRARCGYTEA